MITDNACYVPSIETTVAYRIYGELTTAEYVYVFLHGRGSWGGEFYPVAELFDQTAGCAVVVIDLPGHGRSGMPSLRDPGLWTIKQLAFTVKYVAVDHLGLKRFRLFGHSLGGVIALEYVGWFPKTVSVLYTMGIHYELKSVPGYLLWFDRTTRRVLGNTPLYTWALRYAWYRSRAVASWMRSVIRTGGGYNARRDLMIIEDITQSGRYDYREALERFEATGGEIVLIYALDDVLINRDMEPSREFIHQRTHGRYEVVIEGGHHYHAVDPWPLARALCSH